MLDRTDGLEALAGCGWVQAVDAGALEVDDGLSLGQHGLTQPVDKFLQALAVYQNRDEECDEGVDHVGLVHVADGAKHGLARWIHEGEPRSDTDERKDV